MSTVSPDEPEAQTCGDAFNNAWQCYCASRPSRPLRPPIATTEKISARPDPEPHLTDAPTSTPSRAAPTFQMTRYYRYGELDSCEGRWDAIWACMDSRKRSGQGLSSKAPVIADAKEERAKPYWNLMDPKVRSSTDP